MNWYNKFPVILVFMSWHFFPTPSPAIQCAAVAPKIISTDSAENRFLNPSARPGGIPHPDIVGYVRSNPSPSTGLMAALNRAIQTWLRGPRFNYPVNAMTVADLPSIPPEIISALAGWVPLNLAAFPTGNAPFTDWTAIAISGFAQQPLSLLTTENFWAHFIAAEGRLRTLQRILEEMLESLSPEQFHALSRFFETRQKALNHLAQARAQDRIDNQTFRQLHTLLIQKGFSPQFHQIAVPLSARMAVADFMTALSGEVILPTPTLAIPRDLLEALLKSPVVIRDRPLPTIGAAYQGRGPVNIPPKDIILLPELSPLLQAELARETPDPHFIQNIALLLHQGHRLISAPVTTGPFGNISILETAQGRRNIELLLDYVLRFPEASRDSFNTGVARSMGQLRDQFFSLHNALNDLFLDHSVLSPQAQQWLAHLQNDPTTEVLVSELLTRRWHR